MLAALLALLSSVYVAVGAYYRIEPVAPTDRSFVVLQVRQIWRDGCVPRNRQVTRNGNAFTVRYAVPTSGGCPLAVTEWIDDAPLGVLPAGVYTVTIEVNDRGPIEPQETLRFVVTEAEPALSIEPRIASTAGGTEIAFPRISADATVTVDGVTVPTRVERSMLIATLPAHVAGPVNVQVRTPARTYEMVNAVQYVDPAAAPDPSLYERVLIPVLYQGPGAFGSQWQTDVVMRNFAEFPVRAIPAAAAPQPVVPAGAAVSLSSAFGNRPSGVLLFVPRGSKVGFTSHIRDVSRDATQWGTEMPVVRESEAKDTIALANVPFDPRYRLQLRIYGFDGVTTPVVVNVDPNTLRGVTLVRGACPDVPCNRNEPAYVSLDLRSAFPALTGKHTIFIQQPHLYHPHPIWAFVTVTNNETQHVTVISPQ